MCSANKRRRYYVTPSVIGRAHTLNDPCDICSVLWIQSSIPLFQYLDCLWAQILQLQANDWNERHIQRPYLSFDSVLCEALQHTLQEMIPPSHHDDATYPLPSVIFRMFDYTDVPEVNRALSLYKALFPGMEIPVIKIGQSRGHLIFMIGIPSLVRQLLYIEVAPLPKPPRRFLGELVIFLNDWSVKAFVIRKIVIWFSQLH